MMRVARLTPRMRALLSRRALSDGRKIAAEAKPSEAHQTAATTVFRKQRPEPIRAANPMSPSVAPQTHVQTVAKTSIHTTAAKEAPVASKLKPGLHQMKPPKSAAHLFREQRFNKSSSSSSGAPPQMPAEGPGGAGGSGGVPDKSMARNIGVAGVLGVVALSYWYYRSHKDPLEDYARREPVHQPTVDPLTADELQVVSGSQHQLEHSQAQQPLWLQRPRDGR